MTVYINPMIGQFLSLLCCKMRSFSIAEEQYIFYFRPWSCSENECIEKFVLYIRCMVFFHSKTTWDIKNAAELRKRKKLFLQYPEREYIKIWTPYGVVAVENELSKMYQYKNF